MTQKIGTSLFWLLLLLTSSDELFLEGTFLLCHPMRWSSQNYQSLSLMLFITSFFYFPSLLVLTASNSSTFTSPATGHCNMATCHGLRCSSTFPQLGGSLFGQRTTNVAVLHKKELWMEIELDAGKERKFCRLNGVHNLFFPEVVNWNWI